MLPGSDVTTGKTCVACSVRLLSVGAGVFVCMCVCGAMPPVVSAGRPAVGAVEHRITHFIQTRQKPSEKWSIRSQRLSVILLEMHIPIQQPYMWTPWLAVTLKCNKSRWNKNLCSCYVDENREIEVKKTTRFRASLCTLWPLWSSR